VVFRIQREGEAEGLLLLKKKEGEGLCRDGCGGGVAAEPKYKLYTKII
jgi:hypothetical protein